MADIDLGNSDGDLVINVCRDGTSISPSEKSGYDLAYEHSLEDHAPADADNTASNETSHSDVLVDADTRTSVTESNKIITESDIDVVTGGYPNLGTVTDLNSAILSGRYDFASSTTNAPSTKQGIVYVTVDTSGNIFQLAILFNAGNTPVYKREYSDSLGSWLSWFGLITAVDYATSTVGGTVKIVVDGTDGYITTNGTTAGV